MHPAIKILGLICLGVVLNKLAASSLFALLGLMVVGIVHWQVGTWLKMLLRMRWLFLSICLVYSFTTPGEYVKWMPLSMGVTYEGLQAGFLQIIRLSTMLAAIALLMSTASRSDLIAGFYLLLRPLRLLKLRPERFAARLSLTLQYLEDAELKKQNALTEKSWTQLLNMDLSGQGVYQSQVIELQLPGFVYLDFVGLAVMLVAAVMIWF
jgi:energy-coupling factor transport system permease protein